MVKPAGSDCNINCSYCFYLEKKKLYNNSNDLRMSTELLELYIKQHIEAQPDSVDLYSFSWQGGEPTLMGLCFFKKAVEIQKKHAKGKRVRNTFQTNGILINDEWCQFFSQEGFLVGISLDGAVDHHDAYRKNNAGKGTHERVVAAIHRMQKFNVDFNTLTVLHKNNVQQPLAVYRFLRQLGVKHMQFTPLVERITQEETQSGLTIVHPDFGGLAHISDWSITASQYASFLTGVFDEWALHDIGDIFISNFETTLRLVAGEKSNICVHAKTCGSAVVLEHNGDVYSCDHFVFPNHKVGNIKVNNLKEIVALPEQKLFGRNKLDKLPIECGSCDYINLCNGGCPKHRFEKSLNGMPNKNYFCDGYIAYYRHVIPFLKVIYTHIVRGENKYNLRLELKRMIKQQ